MASLSCDIMSSESVLPADLSIHLFRFPVEKQVITLFVICIIILEKAVTQRGDISHLSCCSAKSRHCSEWLFLCQHPRKDPHAFTLSDSLAFCHMHLYYLSSLLFHTSFFPPVPPSLSLPLIPPLWFPVMWWCSHHYQLGFDTNQWTIIRHNVWIKGLDWWRRQPQAEHNENKKHVEAACRHSVCLQPVHKCQSVLR